LPLPSVEPGSTPPGKVVPTGQDGNRRAGDGQQEGDVLRLAGRKAGDQVKAELAEMDFV
jgi:hypothetical protein